MYRLLRSPISPGNALRPTVTVSQGGVVLVPCANLALKAGTATAVGGAATGMLEIFGLG